MPSPARFPEEPASCSSCGDRSSALAWYGRHLRCSRCGSERLHPIERRPLTFRAVLVDTVTLLRSILWPALTIQVVFAMPLGLLLARSVASSHFAISGLYSLLLLVAQGAVVDLGLQQLDGESPQVRSAVVAGFRRWGAIFTATLVASLVTAVHLLLLIIPGLYRATTYLLVLPLVMARDARSVDALRLSRTRMNGHLWTGFGTWVISLLPILAMGGVTFWLERVFPDQLGLVRALDAITGAAAGLPELALVVVLHGKLRRPTPANTPLPLP